MNDISNQIITAKSILKRLEQLNSNPSLSGHERIFNALIDLDAAIQNMFIELDKK